MGIAASVGCRSNQNSPWLFWQRLSLTLYDLSEQMWHLKKAWDFSLFNAVALISP